MLMNTFHYNSTVVRTAGTSEQPMFCLRDICAVLGIKRTGDVSAALAEKFKGVVLIDTPGGKQSMVCVTEAGLYKVLIRTRKSKIADKFQDWLCEAVLPSIRRTGKYENEELVRQIAILKDTTKTQHNLINALSRDNRKFNVTEVLESDRACQQALTVEMATSFAKKYAREHGWDNKDLYTNAQRVKLVCDFRKRVVYDSSLDRVVFVR